jgi:uncharacterized protein involved in copper resistance
MFTKKTNTMKLNANISKGLLAAVIADCFSLPAQAQQPQKDTAKMSHSKMTPKKMDKMSDGKKMDKMSGGKMTKKPAGKM